MAAPALSPNTPRDDSHPPKFHRSLTTITVDQQMNTLVPLAPWPACQMIAYSPAGANIVFAGEDDVEATFPLPAGLPVPFRGSIARIDATTGDDVVVLASWSSRG